MSLKESIVEDDSTKIRNEHDCDKVGDLTWWEVKHFYLVVEHYRVDTGSEDDQKNK